MPKRTSKHEDVFQAAARVVAQVTGQPAPALSPAAAMRQAASMMGKIGGPRGGRARAKALSPERRSEIAKKAAETRWEKKKR